MRGTVVAFDEKRGLGEIESADGERYAFHCTRIADGSRSIPEQTAVEFEVVAGHLGTWEAARVEKL